MSEAPVVFKDRYEVERELGRGGMSVVYLAKDRQLLSRRVVVKLLLQEADADPWSRKKFLQETEALARIDHPGVVGPLDTGETADGKQFLVMQYVEGVTLRKALPAEGMGLERAAKLLRQMGNALAAAHDKGVWHRDLKPENIMLQTPGDGEEHVKLIDFGIAGVKDSAFGGEKTKVAGSCMYMAPEQFAGKPAAASDVYALGAIAYEMVTGRRPFSADALAHLVAEDQAIPQPPRQLRADLPEAAEQSILKAMAFRAEERFGSIRECGEGLFQSLTAGPGPVPTRKVAADGSLEMAHVLFMDLVGYSLLAMDQQKDYLRQLQDIVRETASFRRATEAGGIVSLPTGDGMALAFFGDPTLPAQCALEVAAALKSRPHLRLRMGIHNGPVYRVADVNTNANVAGGGINLAQRVMDCGDAGHILVSKSVADVLLQLNKWAPLLTDFGEHAVKHGVRIHLYGLATAELGSKTLPRKLGGGGKTQRRWMVAGAGVVLVAGAAAWRLLQAPAAMLQLDYSVAVQKVRDGKPFGDPVRLAGEMLFEKDYGIALDVTSPQGGYLYILNEGILGGTGKRSFNLLEPRGAGSARRDPGAAVRIPPTGWFQFDSATGKETLYLVLSREPVAELEQVKGMPAFRGVVVVDDPGEVSRLGEFLVKQAGRKADIQKNDQARQTELRSGGGILVHAIALEHQ